MSPVQSSLTVRRGRFEYDLHVEALLEGAVLQVFARPADERLQELAGYRSERLVELVVLRDDQYRAVRELLSWSFPEIERLRAQLLAAAQESLPGEQDDDEDDGEDDLESAEVVR